ncbi:hypothetical protein QAD02_020569 [Eretmocerus hayati]|uniref:Uncharacterized protein n=1 Tax=Eretmocerus hayati TaxID=131215 RepID=A0ACC2PPP4_9HYME|nr:hypothetical protein QAD02_020569 [Eretmocerus hayati]
MSDILVNHLTSHTGGVGGAKYHCKFWPKHFRRLQSLKEHVIIYTDQRPYAGSTCARRYLNNDGSRYAHSKCCKQNLIQSRMLAQGSIADHGALGEQIHETDEPKLTFA